ncbi:MAG: prolipoprotein diacylglyceryl transferase [Phycisphaerales bacterium]|jgi:protein-S-isoprenylcysteine O-methyltransferase Ste14|nr:prolipoprotein diacylglyceryl transferase [Phycisphaerales bacterium]
MNLGKFLYAVLFCAAIPAGLAAWAHFAVASPPGVHWPILGWFLAIIGVAPAALAMLELWRKAQALPMNAFPPMRRVETGPFALADNPIYLGFVLACAGAAFITGNAPALWIITPIAALSVAALVMGYEHRATLARLGPRQRRALLSLAPDTDERPPLPARFAAWFTILLPWAILYEAIGHLPTPSAASVELPFEPGAPVVVWTEAMYVLAYPLALAAPLLAARSRDLRRFQTSAIAAMLMAFWCYLAIPVLAPPRPFLDPSPFGRLLSLERADGIDGRVALPSFHVYWAFACAWLISRRGGLWRLAWILAMAITISCWTTGMHALLDLAAGVALFLIAHHHARLYHAFILTCERIANAWWSLRVGPVRILVHALYAGLAAGLGSLIACFLIPADVHMWYAIVVLAGLFGAGAWGQFMEGGGRLSRPFGYFGHIIACSLALLACIIARADQTWLLAAGLATAAPLIQSIGRLRCLVQGCCHGERSDSPHDLHYHIPTSRVCALAGWKGQPVKPTQVWSILIGILIFGLLWRVWTAEPPASMIVGLYLLLTGLTRFVEEHHRGEPQTKVHAGLYSYQWLCIAMFAGGAICTCLPAPIALPADAAPPGAWLVSLAVGLIYAFAMGVDFPASNRRFSLLVPRT